MGREILALLLIALLIAVAGLNIMAADTLTQNIGLCLDEAELASASGRQSEAQAALDAALKIWLNAKSYSHIFIRHQEIDSCTDAFYELKDAILSDSTENCAALFAKLRYHVQSIAEMEKLRLGNIF